MGYLDRLIERAGGHAAPLAPVVSTPRSLGGFEEVTTELVTAAPTPARTEVVRESATVIERRVEPTPVAMPSAKIVEQAPQIVVPAPSDVVTTAVTEAPPPRVELAPASPPVIAAPAEARDAIIPPVVVAPPIIANPVPVQTLRVPVREPEEPVERWLAPAPASPTVSVVPALEPAPIARDVPALPPPQAARPVLPAPPPAVAPLPVADERPALTIGRLVVEVRPQAV
ncbi:MAG: hypothetical protein HOV81_19760, partial [Kofleriaceae bacterium]|nr:hypothetical protein [Kofleriaceae bacterium]